MSACEKCWGDAYVRSLHSGIGQAVEYHRLLAERKDNPCTPAEQAGQFAAEQTEETPT